jgi:uncharacterized protein (TIGR02145 family)
MKKLKRKDKDIKKILLIFILSFFVFTCIASFPLPTITNKIVFAAWSCGDSVTFTYKGSFVTYGTVLGYNNRCWMDRNLGASRVATTYNDSAAYGDLFQWGRLDDGHQSRTSGITATLSSSNNPGHSNFIKSPNSPNDWRSPQNTNLWQGLSGFNNPCPSGWRVPTKTEWQAEKNSWSPQNSSGAYASPLKLTENGYRAYSDASLHHQGSFGYYWTSTVYSDLYSYVLYFYSSDIDISNSYRAQGFSVRCIRDVDAPSIITNCGLPHIGSDKHINSTDMGSNLCEINGEVGIEDGNLYIDSSMNTVLMNENSTLGIENGNFYINSGAVVQMNKNSTIIFNQGKFIRVDGIIAKSANNTVIRKGHISACECTSGACCSDGCNWDDASTVCSTWTEYDYQCSGTGCGDDAQRKSRSASKYCSGSSSSCTGSTSYGTWSEWSLLDNCTATEKCSSDNSTYANCSYASECDTVCDCTSGACCDGCNYRPSSYVCDSTYQTDYGCPWGTGCGDDVGVRYKTRKCSGSSSSCNGTISAWGSYSTYDNCASTETCTNNDSSCNYTPSCDTPPNPSDDIQDCASYGVYDGTSIAVGTAHTGDLLAQNPEGSSFKNYWCKIGTNCTVDEGGTHEIMMWVSGDSVMCKKSPWVCASWHCHVESTFYTGCMYCIVK